MLRKIVIGALVLALTPALALAAPATMTMKNGMTAKPAAAHTVTLKKAHKVKKAEKIRLIQKHRAAVKKMKVVTHLKVRRAPAHKI